MANQCLYFFIRRRFLREEDSGRISSLEDDEQ